MQDLNEHKKEKLIALFAITYRYGPARFIWEYENGWEALDRLPD